MFVQTLSERVVQLTLRTMFAVQKNKFYLDQRPFNFFLSWIFLCQMLCTTLASCVYVHMNVSVCSFCFVVGRPLFLITTSFMGCPLPLSLTLISLSVGA